MEYLPLFPLDRWQESTIYYLANDYGKPKLDLENGKELANWCTKAGVTKILLSSLECPKSQLKPTLSYIARNGLSEFMQIMLPHVEYENINIGDLFGRTPLSLASECGRLRTVKVLLSHSSIDSNLPDNRGETPLIKAVKKGETGVTRLLLAHKGIDVNVEDVYGRTALYWARRYQHPTILRLLLSRGAVDAGDGLAVNGKGPGENNSAAVGLRTLDAE
jgi:ankyrin repeat protein